MSLLDDIKADTARRSLKHGPACGVARVLEALDPEDRHDLQDALGAPADPRIPGHVMSVSIVTALRSQRGINLSQRIVNRHRRGECQCR